jgi:hypothetical protein
LGLVVKGGGLRGEGGEGLFRAGTYYGGVLLVLLVLLLRDLWLLIGFALKLVTALTESVAGDQSDGRKRKVHYGCQQREEAGAVGGRVRV